jgi:hypothetical protein
MPTQQTGICKETTMNRINAKDKFVNDNQGSNEELNTLLGKRRTKWNCQRNDSGNSSGFKYQNPVKKGGIKSADWG